MSQRRSTSKTAHKAAELVEMDGDLSLPHTPLYAPQKTQEEQNSLTDNNKHKSSLTGDHTSIALLTFLYILQGIPLGLAGSVPYLLQSRNVNYKEQAMFSFVYWPFSVKLLWAPIVDAAYFSKIGRRKSWLVPTQYLIGIFMLVLSPYIPYLMGEEEGSPSVNVLLLTTIFFMLNFLAATQDIAVDGWALTMLSRKNVGWASTCNTVGQTAGYFLGNVVFLAFESADFCNRYIRSEPTDKGILTLSGFLYFWGIVFLITTTVVFLVKKEAASPEEDEQGVVETYLQLWQVIRLPAVISLIIILLTCKVGFAAADAITGLKLIEEGVPREKLALLGVPMVPIQIILPFIISKYTAGPKPMNIFLKAMPARLLMGLVFAGIVYWAPSTKTEGEYPFYLYLVILLAYAIHQIFLYSMFVAQMAFFAKVSDPTIGGTYMTLLNTLTNFGGNWPSTTALWMVDGLTWKQCDGAEGACDTDIQRTACAEAGGSCLTTLDGYYILSFVCVIVGFLWLRWKTKSVRQLQDLPLNHWSTS